MGETFSAFCRRVQQIQEGRGWKFARGLTDPDMDAWQTRIGFVFPPEMRELLSIGYPVAARKEDMRSVGPVTSSKGTTILRVRGRHVEIPTSLARRRLFREATYMHWGFVDWGKTTPSNVAFVEELALGRQLDILRFEIQKNGAWPLEWGPRPAPTRPDQGDWRPAPSGDKEEWRRSYDAELDRLIDEHIGDVPPMVPLDSRTLIVSSDEPGMPVFMYWFGSELHLHGFDLAGGLARSASVFPPDMTVTPRWTFWSQFASLYGDAEDSNGVRREYDALVQRMQSSPDPSAVYRSFHEMHATGEDPDPGLWVTLREAGSASG